MASQPSESKDRPESHIGRLLHEISWEGNARIYREGGRGRENVLTAEMFLALDFLPRTEFLGRVLESVIGARETVNVFSQCVEDVTFKLLPGDIYLATHPLPELRVQPDVVIEYPSAPAGQQSVYCFVEAKRIKHGAFQPEQLAREYLAVRQEARKQGQSPLLLLILPTPPPVPVSRNGHLEIHEAIERYLDRALDRCGEKNKFEPREVLLENISSMVAYTTWPALRSAITIGRDKFSCGDRSVERSVLRIATAALEAIEWHSK